MSLIARSALITAGAVVVLVAAVLALLESDLTRRIAESVASQRLGRAVHIGSLDMAYVPRLRIVATGVTIANMETGTTENMVEVARAEAVLDTWSLLTGRLDVLLVALDKPVIVAEKDQQGRGNWQIRDPDQPATEAAPDFPVRKLVVNEGRVVYRDPTEKIDIGVSVQSQTAGGESEVDRLVLQGDGAIGPNRFRLTGAADTILNLRDKEQPYAFEMEVSAGQTRARIAGTLKEPLRAEGLAADLHLEAHDAYDLYQLTGVAIPPTPPYILDGKLYREGDLWRLEPFTAQVGESDLRGKLAFATGGERPKLTGELTSKRIVLGDFGGFIGAQVGEGPAPAKDSGIEQVQRKAEAKEAAGQEQRKPPPKSGGGDGVLPDAEIPFERLRAMDADIKFRGTRIDSPIVPVSEVATQLVLDNGLLNVKPLRFGIGKGKIDITLTLDGRREPARLETVMSVDRVPIGDVLRSVESRLKQYQSSAGILGGRAELRAQGVSLKNLLASSNGNLTLAMDQGRLGSLFIELIGLDIAETLGVVAGGNKPVPVRCAIVDFEFIGGIMGSRAIIIDTTDTNISGEGALNFKTEEINFRLVPRPKDVTPISTRTPITISGSFGDVKIRPEAAPLIARLGIAAALSAILTPLAAPLAFIDVGLGEDSNCAALIREARAGIEKQKREGAAPGQGSGAPGRPAR